MKRNRPTASVGRGIRPPGWSEEEQDHNISEDEEFPPPPARKLLKTILENEVGRAIHELNDDILPLNHFKGHRAASLIPEFDPEGEDCTVSVWLKKIDQLGDIHGWSDKVKSFHLQDKLRGQARKWYNRLDEYNYSWDEWKCMLARSFPKHRDFSASLDEMMNRKKLPNETMTKYYQDKIAMCFRCNLSDTATVSCIIRGLPPSLQPNARAFQCQRPDELYEAFLCALDDYRSPTFETRDKPNKDARQLPNPDKRVNPETDPCPRCKKTGHILRNCLLPDQRICFKCGVRGHIATRCPGSSNTHAKMTAESNSSVKEIKLVQNYNEVYKKVVRVDGIFLKSYIDTGSQVNVINAHIVGLLALKVTPTSTILKGFSGGLLTSRGEVEFDLEIDGIHVKCTAHVTETDMQDIHLLIGQPVINADRMSLVVTNKTATLRLNLDPFAELHVVEDIQKFKVVTSSKESLPPGGSIIRVRVLGNAEKDDVCTAPRHYELNEISYSLPATLLRGGEGFIKVINTGTKDIEWEAGKILARADSCDESAIQPSRDCVIEDCGEIITSDWDVCCRDSTADKLPEYPEDYRDENITVEQLISCIRDVKTAGNCYFGEGKYKAAVRKYRKCLRYLEHAFFRIEEVKDVDTKERIQEIRTTYVSQCNLNMAASYMKLEDYRSTVQYCTAVLEIDPRNEKALYRRGQANYALKNYDDALMDLKQADKVSPNNKAVQKLLDEVRLTNRSYNDIQKQRLSKFFRDQKENETYIAITCEITHEITADTIADH